jgi:hypothetical protein
MATVIQHFCHLYSNRFSGGVFMEYVVRHSKSLWVASSLVLAAGVNASASDEITQLTGDCATAASPI